MKDADEGKPYFKDKLPTTRKRKRLRLNKTFPLKRDVKITKAQSITTHISNTQLYFTAFRRQLSTKRLNNNDGVKFFCRKFSKKSHRVIMKRGNRNNNCPLLSCLRQVFVNNENFIPRGYCCTTNPYCITNYALDVLCNIKSLMMLGGFPVSQYTLLLSPQKKKCCTVISTVMLV